MTVCLFLTFWARSGGPASIGAGEIAQVREVLQGTPGLRRALVHVAAERANDPYLDDGTPPALVLQLYADDLPALEAAAGRDGRLQALASREAFPDLAACDGTQQAMLVRAFPVPDPAIKAAPDGAYCTYLVGYEGEAEDLNLWLDHYLSRHTEHMAHFPGIRELEVYTRLDWVGFLPWKRIAFMQRNKVAFDSVKALSEALHSPIRHEMRADYRAFPPFSGPVTHFPMATRLAVDRP
jgi:hypothetical protein